jgi:hypothetical protein
MGVDPQLSAGHAESAAAIKLADKIKAYMNTAALHISKYIV